MKVLIARLPSQLLHMRLGPYTIGHCSAGCVGMVGTCSHKWGGSGRGGGRMLPERVDFKAAVAVVAYAPRARHAGSQRRRVCGMVGTCSHKCGGQQ